MNDSIPSKKFGKLRLAKDQVIEHTSEKLLWLCDCGKSKMIVVNSVLRGCTQSCGECAQMNVSSGDRFGKLTYIGPDIQMFPKSPSSGRFRCACGKEIELTFNKAAVQHTCGKCNMMPAGWWERAKFGRLRVAKPAEMSKRSIAKIDWICDCGTVKSIRVNHVVAGRTTSCGQCRDSVQKWYGRNAAHLSRMSKLETLEDMPVGGVEPLELVRNSVTPFLAKCPICGSGYRPRLSDIKRGLSLTCGCSSNRVSSLNSEVADFIRSQGMDAVQEHTVASRVYDVFVPSKNLLIEINGLKWHSRPESKARDVSKYENAVKSGFECMMVFEDEWMRKRSIMEAILRNKVGTSKPMALRPSQCRMEFVNSGDVADMMSECHYMGPCAAPINLAIFFDEKIIGAICVRKPARKAHAHYEIARMAMLPEFRVHGVWSKALRMLQSRTGPSDIVTYSDNRLFTGKSYGRMGFKFDGDVKPDYYWTKGGRRFHKSALRKPRGCQTTESALRQSEGYSKIWDLGKKRWIRRGGAG